MKEEKGIGVASDIPLILITIDALYSLLNRTLDILGIFSSLSKSGCPTLNFQA
ncbi:MAG: hypothetical protein ABIH34_06510 [Nanoarchaeota archaeon]